MDETSPPDAVTSQFATLGVSIVEYALTEAELADFERVFPALAPHATGARSDAFSPEAHTVLAAHDALTALAERLANGPVEMTHLQAFDKLPAASWFVPWHQDRSRNGCERDICRLEKTIALRIHLDDCAEDDGPLEVIPSTHGRGRLTSANIAEIAAGAEPLLCLAARGDIVALRPLLLHRSQRARKPTARRVIHIEYTMQEQIRPAGGLNA